MRCPTEHKVVLNKVPLQFHEYVEGCKLIVFVLFGSEKKLKLHFPGVYAMEASAVFRISPMTKHYRLVRRSVLRFVGWIPA